MNEIHPAGVAEPTASNPSRKKPLLIASAAVLVVIAGAVGVFSFNKVQEIKAAEALEEFRATQFESAAKSCGIPSDQYDVIDDGDTAKLSRVTKYDGATGDDAFCFLGKLGAPESLEEKISRTRALDGTREDSWSEFSATWTYHPDSGLNLLVERDGDPVMPAN